MNVELHQIDSGNIDQVKVVFSCVLPVSYPSSFYRDMEKGKLYGRLAVIKRRAVGCVAWTYESGVVHVLALGVLATHRLQGVATQLLEACLMDSKHAYLYVQANNPAVQFYSKRGFNVVKTVEDYYKRVSCTTALKMECIISE